MSEEIAVVHLWFRAGLEGSNASINNIKNLITNPPLQGSFVLCAYCNCSSMALICLLTLWGSKWGQVSLSLSSQAKDKLIRKKRQEIIPKNNNKEEEGEGGVISHPNRSR